MKAVIYTRYGPPEVLHLAEVEKPAPKDNEVLIKVYASTVTVADVRLRAFRVPASFWIPARLSLGVTRPKIEILGAELAGEVEAVGKNVRQFQPGDRVYASNLGTFGGYAEYKCLPAEVVAPMPDNLSFAEAAALPVGASTALHYLRKAGLQPGDKILIYGASGSVGTYAVQLAKYFGAEVTGVCSTSNLEMVKSLGADHVIDYTNEDFSKTGKVYDFVLDAVDKAPYEDCLRTIKAGGTYINVTTPLPNPRMLWTRLTTDKKLLLGENPDEGPDALLFINELIVGGHLKPVLDRIYPLEEIIAAHRYVDGGHKRGNVAISIQSDGKTAPAEVQSPAP